MLIKKIAKYEIVEKLGKGGMGIVYKAFDPLMEREVAIKVLPEHLFDEEEIKERFYREARSAGKLSHENITTVYDLGETDGKPFIVMEYLAGTDLKQIIRKRLKLSLLQKLDYARQISNGLAYSHSKKIVHRDIKPENIRILDEGKAKIMDFGIARPSMSTMTRTGTKIGTPHYMSPEQIKGEPVDYRSDIFSFGVLLYELFTSQLPFRGEDPTTVWYKIVHEQFEPVDTRSLRDAPEISQIIAKCLQKDRRQRYQKISEVIEDLVKLIRRIELSKQETAQKESARTTESSRPGAEVKAAPLQTDQRVAPEEKTRLIRRRPQRSGRAGQALRSKNVAILFGAAAVLNLILYRIFLYVPDPQIGYVALNVIPWARISRIVNDKGAAVTPSADLPDGLITPCRLSLPPGDYKIIVTNPILKDSLTIDLNLKEGETKELNRIFPVFDYSTFRTGFESK